MILQLNNPLFHLVNLRPLLRLSPTSTSTLRLQSKWRPFSTTWNPLGKDPSMPNSPPKHEMVHFPQLASSAGSGSLGEFRRVLHTGLYSQVVAMEIPVGGDIGEEVHTVDQTLLFTRGQCRATVAGKQQSVSASDVVVVPAGTRHQFENVGSEPLTLVTMYAPAEHDSRTVHKTKEEGLREEEEGEDEPPYWSQKSTGENERMGLVKENGGPYEGE